MSLSKTVEIATLELGVCEEPVNRVKYNTAYYGREVSGSAYPWCVTFLWWVFREAQERMAFFGGGKTASCGMLLRWYREQGLTVDIPAIEAGDIVLLNFHKGQDPEHCGLVTAIDRVAATGRLLQIQTIEGNTSPSDGSQSNGGMVCEKTRYPSQIVAVCRPQYSPDPQPVDDVSGHWAEKAIRRCIERGLLKGYPDGSFQPDKPVTRAELAVILDRMEDDGK
jgi:hypothetical protein